MEFPEKIRRYGKRPKDKEATRRILIDAVGEIIRTEGYTALRVNNIARKAGVDKILIYRYFTTPENLIETYIREKDHWWVASKSLRNPLAEEKDDLKEIVTSFLENQFDLLMKDPELRQLVFWEISGKGELMKETSLKRESIYRDLLKQMDHDCKGGGIDLRLLTAILSAGISFMTIHKDAGKHYGIDLNDPAHCVELKRTIRQIVDWTFEVRERQAQI